MKRTKSRCLCVAVLLVAQPLAPAQIVVEGGCTLVDAVTAANADSATGGCPAGSGDDEIVLTADVVLTESVDGVNGLPPFTSGITLRGNGFEVRRDPQAPEFRLLALPNSEFSGLAAVEDVTLSGGSLSADNGGAIWFDSRSAQLVLTNVTLSGNEAQRGGGLHIEDGGYGFYSQVEVVGSRIVDNRAQIGGGIYKAYGGYLDLVSSTISGNTASAVGGGMSTVGGWYPFGQPGFSRVSESTFSGNSADSGGGIRAFGGLYMTNSTISGNYATTAGGGLRAYTGFYEPNTITHTTLTGNSTGSGLGGGLYNSTIYFGLDEELAVESSIVAGNAGTNCWLVGFDIDPTGANFDDDATCGQSWNLMTGLDPALADNGGPTLTHALLADSSAIDAAGSCGLATDQRGQARDDGSCDSGSFELDTDPAAVTISMTGACPGQVDVTVTTAEPAQDVIVWAGEAGGTTTIPSGGCAGTDLGLDPARRWRNLTTDANGNASFGIVGTGGWCGRSLQGIDRNCSTSAVADLP